MCELACFSNHDFLRSGLAAGVGIPRNVWSAVYLLLFMFTGYPGFMRYGSDD